MRKDSYDIAARVDVQSYLRQHDVIYRTLSTDWQNGLVLGNGDLHGVAFGVEDLEWGITKVDVADNRYEGFKHRLDTHKEVLQKVITGQIIDPEMKAYVGPKNEYPYRNCAPDFKHWGRIKLRLSDCGLVTNLTSFDQRLSLYDGLIETSFSSSEDKATIVSFIDSQSNSFLLKCRHTVEGGVPRSVELRRDTDDDLGEPAFGTDGTTLWTEYVIPGGFKYCVMMGISQKQRGSPAAADCLR